MVEYMDDGIKGIVLLILAVAGNFVANTLGCRTQKLLNENMYAKHLVILLILYFAINFTNSNEPMHPKTTLKISLGVYVLFLLFTKMDIYFTMIVFGLIVITYINSTFINYYTKVTPNSKIKRLKNIQMMMYTLMTCLVVIGSVLYYRKQYSEYYKIWSIKKYLFGVNKCKSME